MDNSFENDSNLIDENNFEYIQIVAILQSAKVLGEEGILLSATIVSSSERYFHLLDDNSMFRVVSGYSCWEGRVEGIFFGVIAVLVVDDGH